MGRCLTNISLCQSLFHWAVHEMPHPGCSVFSQAWSPFSLCNPRSPGNPPLLKEDVTRFGYVEGERKGNRKTLPEYSGEFHCLAPSPLHFWTRNQSLSLAPNSHPWDSDGMKATTAQGVRWGCIAMSGTDPLHSPDDGLPINLPWLWAFPALLLIMQRHCWASILSGICGPMSASAWSQMATKTL